LILIVENTVIIWTDMVYLIVIK